MCIATGKRSQHGFFSWSFTAKTSQQIICNSDWLFLVFSLRSWWYCAGAKVKREGKVLAAELYERRKSASPSAAKFRLHTQSRQLHRLETIASRNDS